TARTASHVCKLLDKYGFQRIFSRSDVQKTLGLKPTRSSALMKELAEKGLIEPVTGIGKGKYRFRSHKV
ncbi:MAG: cell filamentation protein, partial [Clostridia bacterium]|nr:cell filamentation protein [Clostridia bacterium]